MSWRDKLYQASYKGIRFKVLDSKTSVGRRNVLHQYPFKDTPYLEDLGLNADVFNVTGYILQTVDNEFDYFRERDALMAALKDSGPGILIHPWLGKKFVGLQGQASIDESFNEGGIARFTMSFVLAGESAEPKGLSDYGDQVGLQSDLVMTAMQTSLSSQYNPTGPNFLKDNALVVATEGITMQINTISNAIKNNAALTTLQNIRSSISTVVGSATNLASTLISTFQEFEDLLDEDRNRALIEMPLALVDFGKAPSDTDASIFGGAIDTVPETTPTRKQEADNQELLTNFFKVGGIAEASRAAAVIDYTSQEEAIEILNMISGAIDTLLESMASETINDELYDAIAGLKPLMVLALEAKGAALPTIRTYQVSSGVEPSLVIAHNRYEDLSREQDLIDRNIISMLHPGFPPSGSSIEVLSE